MMLCSCVKLSFRKVNRDVLPECSAEVSGRPIGLFVLMGLSQLLLLVNRSLLNRVYLVESMRFVEDVSESMHAHAEKR